MPKPSAMVELIVKARSRGWSWSRIAEHYETDPDVVYNEYMAYMESQKTHNEAEYRYLQLLRLEKLIDALWDGVEVGSVDHVKTMLPVIKEISKLLDLHQQKTRIEVDVVEKKQLTLIVDYVSAVAETLQHQVMKTVTAKKTREQLEANWDKWVAEASADPLKQIESAKVEL